ncbi:MAG: hypothetical protein ACYDC3_13605 [Candidatus Binataceae bacterium]
MNRSSDDIFFSRAERGALAVLIYCAVSWLIFGHGLSAGLSTHYVGMSSDPTAFFWFLAWWPYALGRLLNPMFTRLLWAPEGASLAWATPIPLPALVAAPITKMLGPVAAYNLLCLAAPPAAAFSAYLLCRRITNQFWPSLLGGLIFGFSPYMLGQILAHVDLIMIFPVPLAILAVLKFLGAEIRARTYAAAIAALMVAQFLCFPELFATSVMFGAIVFAIALRLSPERSRLLAMIAPTAGALVIALVILSPYLYAMLSAGAFRDAIYPPSLYSTDLLNLVVPASFNWLGTFSPMRAISDHFPGFWIEHGACFGVPLLFVGAAYCRDNWNAPATKIALFSFAAIVIASFGPALLIAGRPVLPMPWLLATHAPLIANALPIRFAMYGFLVLAIIAAQWFASSGASVMLKAAAAAAILITMLPRFGTGFWTTAIQQPSMFTDGSWRASISPDEIILPLPYERNGASMLWQTTAHMGFRMASGYTSIVPPGFKRFPAVRFFLGAIDLPEAPRQIMAFAAQHQIGAIVIDDADPDLETWRHAIDPLGLHMTDSGGAYVYQVPADDRAAYMSLSASDLEARAVALRADILIEALARWFRAGKSAQALSPLALEAAGMLPADWIVKSGFYDYRDYTVAPMDSARVAIVLAGSYGALRPIAERYNGRTAQTYAPYPTLWPGAEKYSDDTQMKFVFEFTPAALEAAADELKSSPPPERTASFWPAAK